MPQTYRVKLSDGREFDVTTEGGPPSEDDVLKAQSQKAPYVADSPLVHRPMNGSEPEEKQPDWKSNLSDMLQSAAHPQSVADLLPLLLPSGGAAAIGKAIKPVGDAIAKYGGAAARLAGTAATTMLPPAMVTPARTALGVLSEIAPSEWNSPLTVAGREGRAHASVKDLLDTYKPNTSSQTAVPFAESASSIKGPVQATYTQLPDGTWGLKGNGLVKGDNVNVMNRAGVGQMHTVGKVLEDGTAEIASKSSTSAKSLISDAEKAKLMAAGFSPELIARMERQLGAGLQP